MLRFAALAHTVVIDPRFASELGLERASALSQRCARHNKTAQHSSVEYTTRFLGCQERNGIVQLSNFQSPVSSLRTKDVKSV